MLRRITLTLIPSVALFTVAFACLAAPRVRTGLVRPTAPSVPVAQLAARSGYIVASS